MVVTSTVPNSSKNMPSAENGAREFHQSNSYSSECSELGIGFGNLVLSEEEGALQGTETFNPVGRIKCNC